MSPSVEATEALAEVWAAIDGKRDKFIACRSNKGLDRQEGHYIGYLIEAEAMRNLLEKRGFIIVPKQ